MQDTQKFYPLKGFEGFYEVTECGIFKSVSRYVPSKAGSFRLKKEKIINPHLHRDGYLQIAISVKSLKTRHPRQIHRLLALTFIPNPNNYPIVNHKDRNKLNNALSNLEWCTASYNVQHNYDNGYKTPNRHLSSDDAKDIRLEYRNWVGLQKDFKSKMAEKYNVSKYVIHDIILNRSYKNLN